MGVENTHGTTSTNIVEPSKFDLVGDGIAVSSATATAAKFAGELLASRSDQHAAEVALEMVTVRAQARVSALEDALVRNHNFRSPVYEGGKGHILQHQTRCSCAKIQLELCGDYVLLGYAQLMPVGRLVGLSIICFVLCDAEWYVNCTSSTPTPPHISFAAARDVRV
jgi:hypothetical protein